MAVTTLDFVLAMDGTSFFKLLPIDGLNLYLISIVCPALAFLQPLVPLLQSMIFPQVSPFVPREIHTTTLHGFYRPGMKTLTINRSLTYIFEFFITPIR